jgi:hypothetical protein
MGAIYSRADSFAMLALCHHDMWPQTFTRGLQAPCGRNEYLPDNCRLETVIIPWFGSFGGIVQRTTWVEVQ